ncbi:MAG: type IV secretion system protein [Deltaproteobacteria bacterium]|nr:type IV secretion system protein [Deltaproteobacteria bacterium]
MAPATITDIGILDDALHQLQDAAATHAFTMLDDASRILTVCAMVYFLALLAQDLMGPHENNLRRLFWVAVTGLFRIGVLNTVIRHAWEWGTAVTDTGSQIGADLAGLSPSSLSPSDIFGYGAHIIGDIWGARSLGMWFHLGSDAVLILVSIVTIVAYAAAAIFYFWVLLEAAYVVLFGPLYIAFSALEWTWPSLFSWAGEVLATTFKLLAVTTMLGIGTSLADDWAATFDSAGTLINLHRNEYADSALIQSLVFLFITTAVPIVAARLVKTHAGGHGYTGFSEAGYGRTTAAAWTGARLVGAPGGRNKQLASVTYQPGTPQSNSARQFQQARLMRGGKP